MADMRLGIADQLGCAVAVTASAEHEVVDRRRLHLVEPGTNDHRMALAAAIVAGDGDPGALAVTPRGDRRSHA